MTRKALHTMTFKTPENVRRNSVKAYRKKNGIPLDLPPYKRTEPFNRKRRGTGNMERKVSMPRESWQRLDRMKGKKTRGECMSIALELLEMTE